MCFLTVEPRRLALLPSYLPLAYFRVGYCGFLTLKALLRSSVEVDLVALQVFLSFGLSRISLDDIRCVGCLVPEAWTCKGACGEFDPLPGKATEDLGNNVGIFHGRCTAPGCATQVKTTHLVTTSVMTNRTNILSHLC